jgi:hypothetical protein
MMTFIRDSLFCSVCNGVYQQWPQWLNMAWPAGYVLWHVNNLGWLALSAYNGVMAAKSGVSAGSYFNALLSVKCLSCSG